MRRPGQEALGVCLFDESWHQGVVGLVAGRIKDRLHRPVIAFARAEDGSLRGSARSVPGVNIRDALDSIAALQPGLIGKFGGHAMAAGLSLRETNLPAFRSAFRGGDRARADRESLTGVIYSDGPLSAAELCIDTARMLRGAGPWGQGFPEPVFDGEFRIVEARIVGDKHMKMRLRICRAHGAEALEAIAFGYVGSSGEAPMNGGAQVQLVYRLEINEYRGARTRAAELPAPQDRVIECVRIRGNGNQSNQTVDQRSRGTHRFLEEVSLITTTSTNVCRK